MGQFADYDALKAGVEAAGGVMTLHMAELRDVNQSGRLGPYVVEAISKQLASRGVGHYPRELPQNQWEKARLFGLGSQIADLYELVDDLSEEGDERLREHSSGNIKEKLDQIRQIIC